MAGPRYFGSFENLRFTKSGAQILEKARAKAEALTDKLAEREKRVAAAAKEAGMDTPADVLLAMRELNDNNSAAGLTVGLAANLRSELAEIAKERQELQRLQLIHRNLAPDRTFDLDFAELEYFGF